HSPSRDPDFVQALEQRVRTCERLGEHTLRLQRAPITMTVTPSPLHTPDPVAQGELSTYWMPLCEPIDEWASFAQHAEQRVPALTAVGHAFFALSHETRAL